MSRFAALPAVLMLAGCGFHLQGAVTMPPEMAQTYVDAADEYSQFHRELRLGLRAAGVDVVDTPEQATAILSVLTDRTDQRVLSVSARNVPTEYEVFYTVEFTLATADKTLLSPRDVTLTRDYTYDTTLVLGKAREEEMIREAIVKDLVRIVLKQISSL